MVLQSHFIFCTKHMHCAAIYFRTGVHCVRRASGDQQRLNNNETTDFQRLFCSVLFWFSLLIFLCTVVFLEVVRVRVRIMVSAKFSLILTTHMVLVNFMLYFFAACDPSCCKDWCAQSMAIFFPLSNEDSQVIQWNFGLLGSLWCLAPLFFL